MPSFLPLVSNIFLGGAVLWLLDFLIYCKTGMGGEGGGVFLLQTTVLPFLKLIFYFKINAFAFPVTVIVCDSPGAV